jgi:hypothetical protein
VNDKPLEPVRVDTRHVSDSILTEILASIAECRLVLADITTIGVLDGLPIRNANVMYEIGIAHATRLPEEVLVFRSDDDRLPFDTANVRVNRYAPDAAPEAARAQVATAILSALQEIDLRKNLAVRRAAESLDYPSWWALARAQGKGGLKHPPSGTMREALGNAPHAAALARLLELGAIRTRYEAVTADLLAASGDRSAVSLISYESTEFGTAVFLEGSNRMQLHSPEVQALLSGLAEPQDGV